MKLVLALFLIHFCVGPIPAQSDQLALTHVTIIDMTGAPAQSDMTVVILKGRIIDIGKAGELTVPNGARSVDASGKFLIPGLWDMHVHWYDEATLPVFLANGVTGVRIMCGYPLHLAWRRRIAEGRLVGPRLVLAGPIVDGDEPAWPDSVRAVNQAEGAIAVQSILRHGYDCVKVYNGLPVDAFFGAAREARRLGFPLVGHVPYAVRASEAAAAGQTSIEHLSGVALACSAREDELRRALRAAVHNHVEPTTAVQLRFEVLAEESYDKDKAAALFACFVENCTWQAPTLIARQAHASLRATNAASGVRMQYMPASLKNRWDNRRTGTLKKLGDEDFANFKRSLLKHLELVGAMHKAGVRFLAGTDTGALDCFAGFSLHEELELLVKGGLTPLEALQAATRNPAEFIGRAGDLGTVEREKLADLVVLDADPLVDIRNTTKIHAVIVNGRLLSKEALRSMLADVKAHSRKPDPEQPPGVHEKYP